MKDKARKFNVLTAVGFVLAAELAGNIGSLATFSQIETWYATLEKPFFNPPNWIFGPVWTILYAFMGIAFYQIWRSGQSQQRRKAIALFALQFILNILWSFIFFGFEQPGLAFVAIIVLWITIVATIRAFYPISKSAAWLLFPYILWVSFATVLNFAIWFLNEVGTIA
jgi:tryptophan-rich sensory protein